MEQITPHDILLEAYRLAALALPAPATIAVKSNKERRWTCYRNTPTCSISLQKNGISYLRVQACEDDGAEAWSLPAWDVTIHHVERTRKTKEYPGFSSRNLYELKLDRPATLQEVKALAQALLEACKYLPEDGTPKL